MITALNQFNENIIHVRHLGQIYLALDNMTTNVIDLSDILRAELVMLVSAFDQFIHEITRIGMLETFENKRLATQAFKRFSVSLDSVQIYTQNTSQVAWLDNEIRIRHGYQSFQKPDKIADAVRLISDIKLWEDVSAVLGTTASDIKNELNVIIERRNKIAHEADRNPVAPYNRWPIDQVMVKRSVDFIEDVTKSIFQLVA